MAVFITLLGVGLVAFFSLMWLIRRYAPGDWPDYAVFLSCAGAIPIGLLAIWLVERTLKKTWHSGLSVQLTAAGVFVEDTRYGQPALAPTDPPAIAWARPFSQLNWTFRLSGYPRGGRERRISEKWICVCTELQQDDGRVSLYTFMPPEQATALTESTAARKSFHSLNMAEIYTNDLRARMGPPARPTIPTTLLHSKDGRYWLAERRRWETGIELTAADFQTVLDQAQAARPDAASAAPPAAATPVTTL